VNARPMPMPAVKVHEAVVVMCDVVPSVVVS